MWTGCLHTSYCCQRLKYSNCVAILPFNSGLFVAAYRGNENANVMELSFYLFQRTTLIQSVILTQNHLLSARKSCVMLGFVGFASAWNCQGHVVGFVGFASLELAGASCWIRWIRSLELSLGSLELSDRIGIPAPARCRVMVPNPEPIAISLYKLCGDSTQFI